GRPPPFEKAVGRGARCSAAGGCGARHGRFAQDMQIAAVSVGIWAERRMRRPREQDVLSVVFSELGAIGRRHEVSLKIKKLTSGSAVVDCPACSAVDYQ